MRDGLTDASPGLSRGLRAAALWAFGLAAGCGPAPDIEHGPPATPSAQARPAGTRDLDDLAAIGYGAWDEGIEPSSRKRSPSDPGRTQPWPRIYADDRHTVHVIGPDGTHRRSIDVPGRTQVEFARVLEGGRILCVSVDEGLTLLEPDGSVVWSRDLAAHHDAQVIPNGAGQGSRTIAALVHAPREFRGRSVQFDSVVFLNEADGEDASAPQSWSSWEQRERLMERAARAHVLDGAPRSDPGQGPAKDAAEAETPARVYDYFHANAIEFDAAGGLVLCMRNVDLIVRLDPADHRITWSLGPGLLDWPHSPSVVGAPGEERLLVFDNGYHRDHSRVVEVDLATQEVLWSFDGDPARSLRSEVRGFAQRLPGGNTLITESERGRALEVTPGGEVVWSFENPEVLPARKGAGERRRRIYRMMAVDPAWLGER